MPDAILVPCPRCGAGVGYGCEPDEPMLKGLSICHERDHAWQAAGRPSSAIDWKMALMWYMFHVYHCEGETYVRRGNGMNCMPPEMKASIQQVEQEWNEMRHISGRLRKPDGSEY